MWSHKTCNCYRRCWPSTYRKVCKCDQAPFRFFGWGLVMRLSNLLFPLEQSTQWIDSLWKLVNCDHLSLNSITYPLSHTLTLEQCHLHAWKTAYVRHVTPVISYNLLMLPHNAMHSLSSLKHGIQINWTFEYLLLTGNKGALYFANMAYAIPAR